MLGVGVGVGKVIGDIPHFQNQIAISVAQTRNPRVTPCGAWEYTAVTVATHLRPIHARLRQCRCLRKKTAPFVQALARKPGSRNSHPDPDLVTFELPVHRVFPSGGARFFSQTQVALPCCARRRRQDRIWGGSVPLETTCPADEIIRAQTAGHKPRGRKQKSFIYSFMMRSPRAQSELFIYQDQLVASF
jgi:hypothetical protein